jgi:UDP-N-acetylglucosamine 2-epimerase (non-hydrolysing)
MGTRILTIFGTRPEAIKMAPVVSRLKHSDVFDVTVCVTAQHRELLDQVLSVFEISPDFDLDIMKCDQGLCEVTSSIMAALPRVFADCRPDRILVHGDTNTSFAAALAAYYKGIPVGHIEAGLRSNDGQVPWPEEMNRKLTATIADLHFAPSDNARRNLVKEGVPARKIVTTGNTVVDALHHVLGLLNSRSPLARRVQEEFDFLDPDRRVILVTGHRRESFNGGIECVCHALAKIAERPDVAIVFPVHPNPNVRGPVCRVLSGKGRVHLIEPVSYPSFVYLLQRAYMVITDSGGIQEEAPSLAKPMLVTRKVSDRPEALVAGTAELVGTDMALIVAKTNALLDDAAYYRRMSVAHQPYGDGKASERIVHYLESYVPA